MAALRDLDTPVMLNMSASPYAQGKLAQRETLLAHLARKYGVWALYANQVGANDDLVFDGRSLAFAPDGTLCRARGGLRRRHADCRYERGRRGRRSVDRTGRGRSVRGARPRCARLRAQVRLHPRAARPVGWHRLRPDGRDRGRGARPGQRHGRADALAVLERGQPDRSPATWRRRWASARRRCPSRR